MWGWEEAPVSWCEHRPNDVGARQEASDSLREEPLRPRRQPVRRPRKRLDVRVWSLERARAGNMNLE